MSEADDSSMDEIQRREEEEEDDDDGLDSDEGPVEDEDQDDGDDEPEEDVDDDDDSEDPDDQDDYDDEMADGDIEFGSVPDMDHEALSDEDGVAMHIMDYDDHIETANVMRHLLGGERREIRMDPGAIFPDGMRDFLLDSGDRGAEVAAMFSAAVGAAVGGRGEPPLLHLSGARDGPFRASLLELHGPGSAISPFGSPSLDDPRSHETDITGVHPLLQRPRPAPVNPAGTARDENQPSPGRLGPSRRRDPFGIHQEIARRDRTAAAILQQFESAGRARGVDGVPYDTLALASGASRAPVQRHLQRDRDRAVPAPLFNRWTYDPPGNGGEDRSLVESSQQAQPARTIRSNDPNFSRVHTALESMLTGIREEEGNVKQTLRAIAERERKENEQEKDENADSPGNADGATRHLRTRPTENEAGPSSDTQAPASNTASGDPMEITPAAEENEDQAARAADDHAGVHGDDDNTEPVDGSSSAQEIQPQTNEIDPQDAQDNGSRRTASVAEIEHARQLGVSERAAHRAAQIGISLQAPADSDPSVVEIATRATGIDPTFLAALPEDMRTEVLANHFSQLSAAAAAAAAAATEGQGGGSEDGLALNQEFLSALPPSLRAEVIEQEANIMAQQEQRGASEDGRGGRGPDPSQEMDNASFLATLAPELRREILVTCDEQFLATLPPALASEANNLRERSRREPPGSFRLQREGPGGVRYYVTDSVRRERAASRQSDGDWRYLDGQWIWISSQKPPKEHKFELDETGVAAVLKLLYVHKAISSSALFRVIFYACRGRLDRSSVIDMVTKFLTHIVYDTDATLPPSLMSLSRGIESTESSVSKQSLISRSLELLIFLAKKDDKTPELIVTGGNTKSGESSSANSSTPFRLLASLLCTDLFQRSSPHLELLVQLLAASTASIQARQKAIEVRQAVSLAVQGLEGANEETVEGNTNNEQGRPVAERTEENGMVEDPKTEADTGSKSEELKPLKVPELSLDELQSLASVLSRQGCSEKTYNRALSIFKDLSSSEHNKLSSISALQASLRSLGTTVKTDFDSFMSAIDVLKDDIRERKIAEFSASAGSAELKLLRVSKAVAALTNEDENKNDDSAVTELESLWTRLGDVLDAVGCNEVEKGEVESTSAKAIVAAMTSSDDARGRSRRSWRHSVPPALARLSPVIEAFFVLNSPGYGAENVGPNQSQDVDASQHNKALENFVEKHRFSVNMLLRANPSLLEGSFRPALKHAQCIDFDNKKAYFRSLLRQRNADVHASTIRINVRRNQVFEDSYHALRLKTADEMKGRLHVQVAGEEGIDAGGVSREWYTILARKIFDLDYALFTRSAAKSATYQPNPLSFLNEDHLVFFKFVGRIMAKAIFDGQLLDAYFTRSFYKHILRIKPNYHDIEALDPGYYKSLLWMLSNDITGVLDLTMSAEDDQLGEVRVVDLVPGGRDIPVTEDNKQEYVKLVTELRTTKAIANQIEAFLQGFHEIIPAEDISIFNELELELLMSGLPDIDTTDLKGNIEYVGYTVSSPQVNWFWRAVSQLGREDLARLIMFVTGTSKVPLEGFASLQGMNGLQKFQIHKIAGDSDRLPAAHTCFNQLDLPEYATFEKLQEKLLIAIREGAEGFGFG